MSPTRSISCIAAAALSVCMCAAPFGASAQAQGTALARRTGAPAAQPAGADDTRDEAGRAYPADMLAPPPQLDPGVEQRARSTPGDAKLRVIVFLEHAPNGAITRAAHAAERDALRALQADRRALLRAQAASRAPRAQRDADGFAALRARSRRDRAALRSLGERHEAISLRLRDRIAQDLRASILPAQAPVVEALEALGADVEFGTLAGNALVARVPAKRVAAVAGIPGVARVADDVLEASFLTNADDATRVNASGGLWANGETGGTFDPAIIDSGADTTNPLLVDQTGYTNFWLWYLVAGSGYSLWADGLDPDDYQGHGTHVQGIVASHGSVGLPDHLGMAYGVEQVVNLKAGFCCGSTGGALMYSSDRMQVIDRALYSTGLISSAGGAGTFNDDIDGMNLSYGGLTTSDETDASRFIDAVVHTYPDLPFTIAAGNDGPSNTDFSSPATSYNAIVVANADDRSTVSRSDDRITASSTRGPTANGRRKPDLAAPGRSISAPNHLWETQADAVNKTGTSMAAPMVLGIAMDLMDAGVTDELEIKALLINTAQKNEPFIDFEDDADGWDPAFGWGYLNAESAYYHRADVISSSVTERLTPGSFRLFAGSMQDEGPSGEGRDRATLVWSRHAAHNGASAPTSYSALSDLNLRLYDEASGIQIDEDLSGIDNVQQVRIGSGAPPTDVVLKAYAWSTSFAHGGATEAFALATEDGFVEVAYPDDFTGIAIWPALVEAGAQFDVEFWLQNDSDVASQANAFDLALPPGFSLNTGADPYAAGSIPGLGGLSTHVVWTLTAPLATGPAELTVTHSHASYGEASSFDDWLIPLEVVTDATPPTPDPSAFAAPPSAIDASQIGMTASSASDATGPVLYDFEFTNSPGGGAGGSGSGEQTSANHTDGALSTNTEYCYRVRARDSAPTPNYTAFSAEACAYTLAALPAADPFSALTTASITANWLPNGNPPGTEFFAENTTAAAGSGWTSASSWTSGSLAPNTPYTFRVKARNGAAIETAWVGLASIHTEAEPPVAGSFSNLTASQIGVDFLANGNPAGTEYFVENTTAATDSGWIVTTSWTSTGLSPSTSHAFRAKARNGDGSETGWVALGSAATLDATPIPGLSLLGRALAALGLLASGLGHWRRHARTPDR